eukprot:gene1650-12775_t
MLKRILQNNKYFVKRNYNKNILSKYPNFSIERNNQDILLNQPTRIGIITVDESGFIYLIRKYRSSVNENVLELPNGFILNEQEEKEGQEERIETVLQSILSDQLGLYSQNFEPFREFFMNTEISNSRILIYKSTGDLSTFDFSKLKFEDKDTKIIKKSIIELKNDILDGNIRDSISLSALSQFIISEETRIYDGEYSSKKTRVGLISLIIGIFIGFIFSYFTSATFIK